MEKICDNIFDVNHWLEEGWKVKNIFRPYWFSKEKQTLYHLEKKNLKKKRIIHIYLWIIFKIAS